MVEKSKRRFQGDCLVAALSANLLWRRTGPSPVR